MTELINGRTPEEIKRVLEWAKFACGDLVCEECPYYENVCSHESYEKIAPDALALIEHLEAKIPKWISVEERLPEDGELVLITMSGELNGRKHFIEAYELATYWSKGEDDEGEYHNEGWDLWDYNEGAVKNFKVFYWMPLPEPPKEGE